MKKEKIIQIIPSLIGGGAERVAINLANEWHRLGVTNEIYTTSGGGEFRNFLSSGVAHHDLGVRRFRLSLIPLLLLFKKKEFDIVLVHMWPLSFLAILCWLFRGRKFRLFVCEHVSLKSHVSHGSAARYVLLMVSLFFYRFASGVVAVSSGLADELNSAFLVPRKKLQMIYNPISSVELMNFYSRKRFPYCNSSSNPKRLVCVGTLKAQKNHLLLLRAFKILSYELDLSLVLVGDGVERQNLEQFIDENGLTSRVLLTGFCPDPMPFIAQADVFVLSSDYEGFANVIVEALICGVPVVSTDCPHGPREILADGRYGVLVPRRDPFALAHGIRIALSTLWDRSALRERATEFSVISQSEKYLSYFSRT